MHTDIHTDRQTNRHMVMTHYLFVMILELTYLSFPSSCCSFTVIRPTGARNLRGGEGREEGREGGRGEG